MRAFATDVFRILRGSIVGQFILFCSMPILARIYSPADFGIAQAAMSMLTVLLIAGSLRLDVAVLSAPDSALKDIFRCAWWLSVGVCGAVWVAAAVIASWNPDWTVSQRLSLLMLPPIGILANWNQLISYLALRRQAFGATANSKIVQPSGYAVGALVMGYAHPTAASLVAADAIARMSSTVILARSVKIKAHDLALPTIKTIRTVLCNHRQLVTVGLVAALVNAAGSAFTAALLLTVFGALEAGQYSMVERIIGMPVGVLAASISQVFMGNLSRSIALQDVRSSRITFRTILRNQTLSGVPVAVALFLLAPWLLQLLLGPGWEAAGKFARALVPLYLFAYIVGPLNMTLTLIGRQHLQLAWDCLRLVLTGATWLLIMRLSLDSVSALWLYSATGCVSFFIYAVLADQALQNWSSTANQSP